MYTFRPSTMVVNRQELTTQVYTWGGPQPFLFVVVLTLRAGLHSLCVVAFNSLATYSDLLPWQPYNASCAWEERRVRAEELVK